MNSLMRKFITLIIGGTVTCSSSGGLNVKKTNPTDPLKEIVLGENHPVYYNNINNAFEYAKKTPGDAIFISEVGAGGAKYSRYGDNTALCVEGFKNDITIIEGIEIYLNHINANMDEKEAIQLANEYLPKDIITKYYKKAKCKKLIPNDEREKKYKIMEYNWNELGENQKHSEEFKYLMPTIYVTFEEKDEKVSMIRIYSNLPKWMSFLSLNGYKSEEWSVAK